ncbi:superfamily II ATP-dependent DNA/RNA helicase [Streptococcus pneumoniae]|nr:superfamily II ATP-dependent DNA/RNA helicase [Streptococcus pneumoniae]
MKVNLDYLGRLFTENELTEEERQLAEKLPAMRKEKGKLFCQRCNSIILEEWYLPIGAPNFKLKLATQKKFTWRLVVQAFFRVVVNPIFDKSYFFRSRFLGSFR